MSDRPTAAGPLLLLFVDGVGLAPAGPQNPFSREPMPALRELLGGPLCLESVGSPPGRVLRELDATLGVDGLPQSATGQTTLFTGINAASRLGRHVPAFPGRELIRLIERHGVVERLVAAGRSCTFANAFRDAPRAGDRRRWSVTTHAILAAGLPFRQLRDLEAGAAVTWDVCGDGLARVLGIELPPVEPQQAGRRLAALAADHDFTLFETFMTDLAGHRRFGWTPAEALRRLDGLVEGIVSAAERGLTLVLTSDHGNLEAAGRLHTRNPVPLLAIGPAAPEFRRIRSLSGVARILGRALGVDPLP